jgi:hypothetical protein
VPDLQTLTCPSCLVAYTAVIWYGYNEALAARPAEKSEAEIKLAKLLMSKADRPDVWVSPTCCSTSNWGTWEPGGDALSAFSCRCIMAMAAVCD